MAIRRSYNALNQVRVSVPDVRSIESAVRSDFDELLSGLITGSGKPYVVRGFEIEMAGSIGSSANGLQVIVDRSTILHGTSATAGTFYIVPPGTPSQTLSSTINSRVQGSFTPSSLNYVGIDYSRQVDNTTAIQRYFWSPATRSEFVKTAPQSELLDYRFVISTSPFSSNTNVLPLAIIETDGANNVLSVEDRRPMLFRLGTAGAGAPDPTYEYGWDNQAEGRVENPSLSSASTISPFRGGDKQIFSMKEMFDALMTEFKLIKGTPFWYSENIGGSIYRVRTDLANTVITSKGSVTHDPAVSGRINWSDDIELIVVGSRIQYSILANPSSSNVTLANNQVAYVTLVRDVAIIPNLIFTNGSAAVSSVGSVSWTTTLVAGDYVKTLFAGDEKYYKIQSVDSTSQVTLTEPYLETSTGSGGTKSQYAWGVYESVAVPTSNRHVKVGDRKDVLVNQNNYWLYVRKDNGIPAAQQTEIITRADVGGDLNGTSFKMSSNDNLRKYYFLFTDGTAVDPAFPDEIKVEVPFEANMSAAQIAEVLQDVIEEQSDFNASVSIDTVTVQNALFGAAKDAEDVDTGFGITTLVRGVKAKVYARFFGSELEQGETRQISDNKNAEVIKYIGARSETDSTPSYSSAFQQVSQQSYRITFPAASSITSGDSLRIRSGNDRRTYFLYFNKDGAGGSPAFLDELPIQSNISTGFSNLQVAASAAAAISATGDFNATNNGDGSVTISPTLAGRTSAPENISVTGATIQSLTLGSGEINHYIQDGQNLTQAIKILDEVLYAFTQAYKEAAYEESFTVVAVPAGVYEIPPTPANTIIQLPLDSARGFAATSYTVGANQIEVILNGQNLSRGEDFLEVGAVDDKSIQIEVLFDLELDDYLTIRMDSGVVGKVGGAGSGTGGEINTASNVGVTGAGVFKAKVGVDLQFKRIVQGAGTSIVENADSVVISATPSVAAKAVQTVNGANYNATVANDYIRVLNSGSDVTVTLPDIPNVGKEITIKKVDSGNTLFIATVGGQTIDGVNATATPLIVTILNESVTVIYYGSGWEII